MIMELSRFYCRSINAPFVELGASEAYHLFIVLRAVDGNKVELFDGAGTLAMATVIEANRKKVTLKVDKMQVIPRSTGPKIIIAPSIAKGERLDWLIGKCTELGVDCICPVLFERTVKQSKNPKITERWQNLAIAAAKQCRRLFLPQIDMPMPLHQILKVLKNKHPSARILLGSLCSQCPTLINQHFGLNDVVVFIGPEGGLTVEEELVLQNAGAQMVRLTDTVLRVETAAIAFASILAAQRNLG